MNIGEEICGEWLRHVRGCEFIQYNLKPPDWQGEIDVIGLDLTRRRVYACEVAVHLITGLQYVKDRRPDNVPRLIAKLERDYQYVSRAFPDFGHELMLWSPVVRDQRRGSKYNQLRDIGEIVDGVRASTGAEVVAIVNEEFQDALRALRKVAGSETKELDSSVMRYLQVEEHLARHLEHLGKD